MLEKYWKSKSLREGLFVGSCFTIALLTSYTTFDTFFHESLVFLGACTVFTITSFLHQKKVSQTPLQNSLNGCAWILLLSVGLYFLVKDSMLAEVGHISLTLATMSLLLATSYGITNFTSRETPKRSLRYITAGLMGVQIIASMAIDDELIAIEFLQIFLGLAFSTLAATQIHYLYRCGKGKTFKDHEQLYLSIPIAILTINTLIDPGLMQYFNLTMSASCLCLYYRSHQSHIEAVAKDTQLNDSLKDQMEQITRNLSFEVREHLNNVLMQNGIIAEEPFDSHIDLHKGIQNVSLAMLNEVDNYILLKEIIEGKEPQKSSIPVDEFKTEIRNSFQPGKGGRKLSFHIPDSLSSLYGHKTMMRQAILNIVNRVEYQHLDFGIHFYNTVKGETKYTNIDIRGGQSDQSSSTLANARNRFKYFDYSKYKFVSTLAEVLGGGFIIKETSRQNPLFTFFIPHIEEERTEQEKVILDESSQARDEQYPENSVLVVDDDPEIVDLISEFIESYGINSIKSQEGKKALNLFRKAQPKCIITDILMPEMSGIELIKNVRKNQKKNTDCVVIGITGASNGELRKQAIKSGADVFYYKPPDLNNIVNEVQKAIHSQKNKS